MHHVDLYSALLGGCLIGLAASLFLVTSGRICGVSGLFAGLVFGHGEARGLRLAFLAGLISFGLVLRALYPQAFASPSAPPWRFVIPAGLLVGFGTQLGSGCTSGHGICGIARLSIRSLVATATFMATGFATVWLVKHVLGGI